MRQRKKNKNLCVLLADFRALVCCRFQPRFHHSSTTFYHAFHHVLRTKKVQNPPAKTPSTTPKKITKYTAKGPDLSQ